MVQRAEYLRLFSHRTTGTAYTFFTPDNYKHARDLVKILEEAKQDVDPKLRDLAQAGGGKIDIIITGIGKHP